MAMATATRGNPDNTSWYKNVDPRLIWRKIRRVWVAVINDVKFEDHRDYLYQEGALNEDDEERVSAERTSRDKTAKLMRILQKSNLPKSLHSFLESLHDKSVHVFKMIEEAEPVEEDPVYVDDTKRNTVDSSEEEEWPTLTKSQKAVETFETGTEIIREGGKSIAECTDAGLDSWSIEKMVKWTDKFSFADDNLQETFKKQYVSGCVFANITYDDLGNLFPTMPFGHKKIILSERDKLKNKVGGRMSSKAAEMTTSRVSDRFRKFDSVSPDTTYRHNSYLPVKGQHSDNLLEPVHNFFKIEDLKSQPILRKLQNAILTFAAACLNDRTNGTIHFGVEEDDDGGKIVGIAVDQTKVSEALEKSLQANLHKCDLIAVKNCVRPPKFVPVVGKDVGHSERFIVEVDVVASFQLCLYQDFCVRQGEFKFYRFKEGVPGVQTEEEVAEFQKCKYDLANRRQTMETTSTNVEKQRTKPDLRSKLINHLCQGETTMEGDLYPILVITKSSRTKQKQADVKPEFGFLKCFPWKAVFDFDNCNEGGASLYTFLEEEEQLLKLLTVEEFDRYSILNQKNPQKFQTVVDDLKNRNHRTWIFANGYEPTGHEEMGVAKWKESRSEGFKECVSVLRNHIPQGRAVVIFILLSKEFDVVLEVADELCTRFKNQWFILADCEEIASQFKSGMMRKNILEKRTDLENNCVIGIPWHQVNETIIQLLGAQEEGACMLPNSNGTYTHLREIIKNELVDLDILSRNQYNDSDIVKDQEKFDQHSLETEDKFYKGGEVDWWNFYFPSHVNKRSCYSTLREQVVNALGDVQEDSKVGRVYLYHQPGSGGTTCARHILWDLKDKYRCAVVKEITAQTCHQISKLRSYNDQAPNPVLLLLDNKDSEKISDLKAELEDIAKQDMENRGRFYVFLVCDRGSRALFRKDALQCVLKHKLEPDEVGWFIKKCKELENDDKRQVRGGLDPKHLISFNIMKENFSPEFIKRTVKELVKDTTDPRERTLLKYVALLNSYDLKFHSVLSSSFDPIMASGKIPKRWELHMSQPLNVLLDFSLKSGLIRITHRLLSKEIVDTLSNVENCDQGQLGNVALEFLNSTIFLQTNRAVESLLTIVKGIVIVRAKKPDGWNETKFAPLIQSIVDDQSQGVPKASDVLIKVLDMTEDVFVAQQVARLYIHAQDWKKALYYAKHATRTKPDNSYLWDTLARVHNSYVVQKYNECIQSGKQVGSQESMEVVDEAILAVDTFQKEQTVSQDEQTKSCTNNGGYYGEITVIFQLLDYLSNLEGLTLEELHAFLVEGGSHIPAQLQHLGEERIAKLRGLQDGALQALAQLEDEYLQLRDDAGDDYRKTEAQRGIGVLIKLKENIEHYYGEEDDQVPAHLTPEEACKYRRRRIFRLSGCTSSGMFEILKNHPAKAKQTLGTVSRLVHSNSKTKYMNASDIQTLLMVNIALCILNDSNRTTIEQEKMAGLSKQLYERRDELGGISLEPYMFVLMFNWPRENMANNTKVFAREFADIIRNWKSAFTKKYPRQREEGSSRTYRRKETTQFFLGKKNDMSFVHNRELPDSSKRGGFWRTPEAHNRLERWPGILMDEGNEVKLVREQNGVRSSIFIPTSLPVRQDLWWKKPVYFVIGFTWSGPKAYDVDMVLPEPSEEPDHSTSSRAGGRTGTQGASPLPFPDIHLHAPFQKKLHDIQGQLHHIHQLKKKRSRAYKCNKEEWQLLHKESSLKREERNLIKSRQTVAEAFDLDS